MTTENTILYPIEATYKYNGVDYPINFKSDIGIGEVGALVQLITSEIVDEYGYHPYAYDTSLYGRILSFLSDFDPSDIINLDNVLRHSDIKDIVHANIHDFKKISDCVDFAIEFQKQKLANKSEFDSLIFDIRKIVADVNERFIKPLDSKTFEKLVKNLSAMKMTEKGLIDALIKSKVIDKKFPEKNNKETSKGKVINFSGQQNFDGEELKTDEIE